MDEFQCCNPEDFQVLADVLESEGTIVFPYSEDRETAYVISISAKWRKVGIMPFYGKPAGWIVSLIGRAAFWFEPANGFHASYLAEKLHLNEYESKVVSQLLIGIAEAYRSLK